MPRRQRPSRDRLDGNAQSPTLVRAGECRIAYQVYGDEGAMVLLLQPFWLSLEDVASDSATFGPQLAGRYRVIVHDRRGTGESERHPGQISTRVQADDLVAILDEIGVNRVLLLAMTESAPLAVHFAALYPERVARMVLLDPHLRPRTGPGSTMLLQTLHSRPRVGLRAFARSLVNDDRAADALAERMSGRLDAPTAARLFEAFLQADALSITGSVAARTLLAFGVHDRMVVEEEARELQSHFPSCQIGLVEGTPGTAAAAREAWVQIQDFLSAAPAPSAEDRPPAPRPTLPRSGARGGPVGDFVPPGGPPAVRPVAMVQGVGTPLTHPGVAPAMVRWAPPAEVPREAVELNRKAVDHILLGEIEQALTLFQQAMDIAPDYEDAAINYRELLSRLVQRRVAQWQTQQAELMMKEAERQAARYAKRTKRFGLGRFFGGGGEAPA
jgi:pimeloyl-ACP methyl ester carboxylesterase